jgi:hypothetical protein
LHSGRYLETAAAYPVDAEINKIADGNIARIRAGVLLSLT